MHIKMAAKLNHKKHVRAGHKNIVQKWTAEVGTIATAVDGGGKLDAARLAHGLQEQLDTFD